MAHRGVYIGEAYIENRGMARVYQDMDNTRFLFCDLKNRDETLYMARARVKFRKTQTVAAQMPTESRPLYEQLTLF